MICSFCTLLSSLCKKLMTNDTPGRNCMTDHKHWHKDEFCGLKTSLIFWEFYQKGCFIWRLKISNEDRMQWWTCGQNRHISDWRLETTKRGETLYFALFTKCQRSNQIKKDYIFLTVHLRIIPVGNQLKTQFLLWYVYLNPLLVSSNCVLILSRTIVSIQHLV